MKKVLCLVLVFALCVTFCPFVSAAGDTSFSLSSQVYELAYDLLFKALCNNTYFDIAYDDNTVFSLCEPLNAYQLVDGAISQNSNIEYYLIKTDVDYIGCVTVCYENGDLLSASFDTNIAQAVNCYGSNGTPIALIGYNGTLYVKSPQNTFAWTPTPLSEVAEVCNESTSDLYDATISVIDSSDCALAEISPIYDFPSSITQTITPRVSSILDVPYVPQYSYPICWASATAAFGQYYTDSSISGTDVAYRTKGALIGGTIIDCQSALRNLFGISTAIYEGQMSYSSIINYLMGSAPLLVAFADNSKTNGHAAVLCGFSYTGASTTSPITYYFRDSNFSSLKIVTTSVDSPIALDYYSGDLMYWRGALYKTA